MLLKDLYEIGKIEGEHQRNWELDEDKEGSTENYLNSMLHYSKIYKINSVSNNLYKYLEPEENEEDFGPDEMYILEDRYGALLKREIVNEIEKRIKEKIIDTNNISKEIADELMYECDEYQIINYDTVEKECYLAIADIKRDIWDKVEEILDKNEYKID